jgi:uncharacterized membrane protein
MPIDIGGVPTHPLVVHLPVVLVPLALIMVIAYFFAPPWRRPLAWISGVVSGAGALGAVLAANSGESLQERVPESKALHDHADMGETAQYLALIFFVVVVLLVVFQEVRSRRVDDQQSSGTMSTIVSHRAAYPVLAVLLLISGGVAVASLVAAGHAGAKVTWENVGRPP